MINEIDRVKRAEQQNSALSEAAVVFASRIWIAISAIATQSVLAWLLGPADRGAYAVCVMFGSLFGVIFGIGIDRGTQYFLMSGKISLSNAISVMIMVSTIGAIVGVLIASVLLEMPLELFNKAQHSSFLIALLLIPLTMFSTGFRLQLAGLRKFIAMAKVDIVRTTINLLLILLLVAILDWGVNGALIAQVLCLAIAVLLMMTGLWRNDGFRPAAIMRNDVKPIVWYGIRYYIARIGHVVDAALGTMILAFLATQTELGLFAAASALTLSILMIADSIEVILLPRIAADSGGRPQLVARVARLAAAVTALFVLLLVGASTPIVRLLLSPDFLDAVPLIFWLAPGVVVQGFNSILMSFFRGHNYPHICSWAVWIGLAINALGIFLLYPVIGVAAAAVSLSLGFFGRAIMLSVIFCRFNSYRFVDLISPTREDAALLLQMLNAVREQIGARLRTR